MDFSLEDNSCVTQVDSCSSARASCSLTLRLEFLELFSQVLDLLPKRRFLLLKRCEFLGSISPLRLIAEKAASFWVS